MKNKISVTEYNINTKAKVSRKLTFAFVSDMHEFENEPVLSALDSLNERERLDAVLTGGDIIHDEWHYKRGLEFIRQLCPRYKAFFISGNHDVKSELEYPAVIESSGGVLLDDRYVKFEDIYIGGLKSASRKRKQPQGRVDARFLREFDSLGGFRLLLCHHPEYYEQFIRQTGVDLTLSGHAHGGQWRIFGQGIYSPGQGLFPKYTSGKYDGRLIVSRGIGNMSLLPRINNKPEILLIRLQ